MFHVREYADLEKFLEDKNVFDKLTVKFYIPQKIQHIPNTSYSVEAIIILILMLVFVHVSNGLKTIQYV